MHKRVHTHTHTDTYRHIPILVHGEDLKLQVFGGAAPDAHGVHRQNELGLVFARRVEVIEHVLGEHEPVLLPLPRERLTSLKKKGGGTTAANSRMERVFFQSMNRGKKSKIQKYVKKKKTRNSIHRIHNTKHCSHTHLVQVPGDWPS